MDLPRPQDLTVASLGERRFRSPLRGEAFVRDGAGVLVSDDCDELAPFLRTGEPPPAFELAGPRASIFFDPGDLACGIVTCGGLCPGINNVIRSIVLTLHHHYGVGRVLGFRYGFAGLAPDRGFAPLALDLEAVRRIHESGGTVLGTSRGPQEPAVMADTLQRLGVGILFAIGGDGTLRGAAALDAELRRRGAPIAVVAVPKTIDNDIAWIERSFGFSTAVDAARTAIQAAHTEAASSLNGLGLVKLMGRHAGFIAAEASLASADVNFCLVPEFRFQLDGKGGLLEKVEQRLRQRRHAVVVVAEGAGQELFDAAEAGRDASGNVKLHDIGQRLRDALEAHLKARGVELTLKYIDPSYMIRSLPANALDSMLCLSLGQHAVHAGMAGRTGVVVAFRRSAFVHVPIALAITRRRELRQGDWIWQRVLASTGQGSLAGADAS